MYCNAWMRFLRLGRYLAASVIFLTLWPLWAEATDTIHIQMFQKAIVDRQKVRLGQIADVVGRNPQQVRKLEGLTIDQAPLPGQSRLIHPGHIKSRLRQFGIDSSLFSITSSGPVKVLRRSTQMTPDKIRTAVRSFIKTHAPWHADQMKIGPIKFNHALTLPSGKTKLHISAPRHTDWLGGVPFSVKVVVDGQVVKKFSVPTRIEVWSDVLMAAKPLGRYQPIGIKDIKIKKMNLARVPANVIVSTETVLGRRTNRKIAVNAILRKDQVEMPPLIKRGDVVRVVAESPSVKVVVQGKAKQDGGKGERIKVINLASKKTIYAQVMDEKTVQVEF